MGPNFTTSAVHEASKVDGSSGSPRQCADVVVASQTAGWGGSGWGLGAGAGGAGAGGAGAGVGAGGAGGAGVGLVVTFDPWTDESVCVGAVGEPLHPDIRASVPNSVTAATVEFAMAVTAANRVLA